VAFKLRQFGFTRIRPLAGGLEAWIEAGLPVEQDELEAAGWSGSPLESEEGADRDLPPSADRGQ
jgi:3-mercaptopyruvate sulfurtransferase SseA